jgi:hypothetical protein
MGRRAAGSAVVGWAAAAASAAVAASAVALGLAAGGCMTAAPSVLDRQQPYVEADYAPYKRDGTAEVSGRAIARTRGGGFIYAAEDTVYLFPATPYTGEWWQRTMVEGSYLTPPDPRSLSYMRTTVADEEGKFRFRSLPPGEYYVVCIVTWPDPEEGRPMQVANLGKRVTLRASDKADAQLELISRHRALVDPAPTQFSDQ